MPVGRIGCEWKEGFLAFALEEMEKLLCEYFVSKMRDMVCHE